MPYSSIADLPDSVRDNLPKHAQEIYKEAFNSAFDEYAERGAKGREVTADNVAWTAVKKKYRKDEASGKSHEAGNEWRRWQLRRNRKEAATNASV
ncbi:ChaB family protein [Massilia sp. TWR1-2-2]|uniref:ChaB family protein n=1 Tax=Massilia sp. TWR1-2-2 TaxID=2804584 RepID=UPI003CF85CC4